jgi:hypothetical protein
MDGKRFDAIAQSLAFSRDRRGIVRLLTGSALGGLVLASASDADAKGKKNKKNKNKNKKITICHNGQTITVSKNAKKGHLKHGDTLGECQSSPPPPPPPTTTCGDGVQNGTETDVDCGGASCPRCAVGKKCSSRSDCATSLCVGGVCKSCVDGNECGLQADGATNCFCRDSKLVPGTKICTNQNGRTIGVGTPCTGCNANEACTPAGADTECVVFCGAT